MKKKFYIIPFIIIFFPSLSYSDNSDISFILSSLSFPEPNLQLGHIINKPLYAVNIVDKETDEIKIRENIKELELKIKGKSDPEIFFQLGNYYKDIKCFKNAVIYYNRYLESSHPFYKINNKETKKLKNIGEIYYSLSEIDSHSSESDNLQQSLLFFTKAIESDPDNDEIFLKLGDCYLSLGKTTEALFCYNKVLEKNNDIEIYTRIQAASFQNDYLKLIESKNIDEIENQPITQYFNFDYLQTAINNSPESLKENLKIQQYIYLIRLLLIKNEFLLKKNYLLSIDYNKRFSKDEFLILSEAEQIINNIEIKNVNIINKKYISGIVNYLKSDYNKSFSIFKEIPNDDILYRTVYDDMIFIGFNFLDDKMETINLIKKKIKTDPDPEDYLILAGIEFRNHNYSKCEMICNQSLKISKSYPETYSALSVIYTLDGNYLAADEMIKKGNSIIKDDLFNNKKLSMQIKLNEAVIALLKNEKEKAYILLRSVLSVDNNQKSLQLYNRFFLRNE